jgi:two-component system, sensor histidine kinase PdtaS
MNRTKHILFCIVLLVSIASVFSQSASIKKELTYLNNNLYENPDSALVVCERALDKTKKGSKEYAILLARRAVINDIKGRADLAVKDFLNAIQIQEKMKDTAELSYSYNNLGVCYFYQYRYPEAIKNYNKSAELDSLQKNISGWAGTQLNIAIIYSNQSKIAEAQQIYDMVLNRMAQINDFSLHPSIYSNSAKLYILEKNYKKALEMTELARPGMMKSKDPSPKMTLEVIASTAYMGLGNFDASLTAAKRGIAYDPEKNYPERRMHLYECLSHVFFAKTEIDSANYYNDRFQELRDSLFVQETQEQLSTIQTKYDLVKKDEELAQSKLRQVQYRNWIIAIVSLFVILTLILFLYLEKRRSEKRLLNEQLHTQEKLVEQKEAFLGEIHHRVKNNLQMVSSMLALQQMASKEESVQGVLEASRSRIETMSLIHERLYQNSGDRIIDLENYVQELTQQIESAYTGPCSVQFSFNVCPIQLHIDTVVPLALILNELITNSLKYAFVGKEQGSIHIAIFDQKEGLLLDYADSGIGFDPEVNKGFGSKLLASLSRQLKATTTYELRKDGFHILMQITRLKRHEE